MSIKQRETILVASAATNARFSLIVGNRTNLNHKGSTMGDSLYDVKKNDLKFVPKVSTEKKKELLGGRRFKDSRDRDKSGNDVEGALEPVNWSTPAPSLVQELCHRFNAKAMVLLTAGCPSVTEVTLMRQIPLLAICPWSFNHVFSSSCQ